MELDITILYLIVVFFALWLVVRVLPLSENFVANLSGLPTYRQQLDIATLRNNARQMKRRLVTINGELSRPNIGVWVRNYWKRQHVLHALRLKNLRGQLSNLVQRINAGPAARIVPVREATGSFLGGPQAPLFSGPAH